MGYIHTEIITEQISKKVNKPNGDVTGNYRDNTSTIHFLCDGVGSGLKANLAATMTISRMKEMVSSGFTLRQTFGSVIKTMEDARAKDLPCAFFSSVRILNDGIASVFTYDMPEPIFVAKRYSTLLKGMTHQFGDGVVNEWNCSLAIGEGLLLMSDGITQAGLGKGLPHGWGSENVNKFVSECLKNGAKTIELPKLIIDEAYKYWHKEPGDDLTVSLVQCRKGRVVNLFSGPPANPEDDFNIISKFLSNEGLKIVCGATTAKLTAKVLNKEFEINPSFNSMIAPPDYSIEGIDLVTEGAVTLNQLYNVWEEDFSKFEKNSPVTELYSMLNGADKINIFLGKSINPASDDISFVQSGILTRQRIIPLIINRLKEDGKLVNIIEF